MGHLRDRLIANLKLAGRSESTRGHNISIVVLYVKHHCRAPEQMGEVEVRQSLLFLAEKNI